MKKTVLFLIVNLFVVSAFCQFIPRDYRTVEKCGYSTRAKAVEARKSVIMQSDESPTGTDGTYYNEKLGSYCYIVDLVCNNPMPTEPLNSDFAKLYTGNQILYIDFSMKYLETITPKDARIVSKCGYMTNDQAVRAAKQTVFNIADEELGDLITNRGADGTYCFWQVVNCTGGGLPNPFEPLNK